MIAARELIQHTAQDLQSRVHKRISAVVSKCLSSVFDDPYSLEIEFLKKRGKTEAILSFRRNGIDVDPLDASGGGVVDIAAFALRLSYIICSMPQLRRVLILDEPWKFVAVELRPACAQMIETLARDLNVQFIIVTHFPEFEIGKVIEIS